MALYTDVKATVDAYIIDNISELIIPADHRLVDKAIIDACGAAQVYVFPATTDNPGTPQNPRAYIAAPGTYTNFGNLTVTAPLGVLAWDGSNWSVTQITIPSGHNYFYCRTTAALVQNTTYTQISVTELISSGEVLPGQWVKLINRRTGVFDFVQVSAEYAGEATLYISSWKMRESFPVGSIVEFFPTIGMRDWRHIPVAGAGVNFVNVPADWRMPPVEAVDLIIYDEMLDVIVGTLQCYWSASPTEVTDYGVDAADRTKIEFAQNFEGGEIVRIRLRQPAILAPEPS